MPDVDVELQADIVDGKIYVDAEALIKIYKRQIIMWKKHPAAVRVLESHIAALQNLIKDIKAKNNL